jgi:hypothetical protein
MMPLLWQLAIVLTLSLGLDSAQGATYFISPTGSDENRGTAIGSPWKTFDYAVPQLRPGDTLMLMDGAYMKRSSGHLTIAGANGTASRPITFQAQSQRKAHLEGDGLTATMSIDNSSYVIIDGIEVSSKDDSSATSAPDPVFVNSSHHLIFRNMLIHHNNRYKNSHLMTLKRVSDSLVEDSELYYHHRHGILVYRSNSNTFRRLYCNSRGYGNIPGGFPNGHGVTGGDVCVSIYPGSNNLLENVISDGPQVAFDIQATALSSENRFLGIVGIDGWCGAVIKARGNTAAEQPVNNVIKDMVVINAESVGIYARGAKGTRCDQCTIMRSGNSGVIADVEAGYSGGGTATFYAMNILSVDNKKHGFGISQTEWLLEFTNSYNNAGMAYIPATTDKLLNKIERDPQLGSCKVYLPDNSPMKGAGKDRADIGANVLYRYQDGVLTDSPLWDPITGKFPCGAIVAGVNDLPGSSCTDVHQRLNVNTNGCPFPASFRERFVNKTVPGPS